MNCCFKTTCSKWSLLLSFARSHKIVLINIPLTDNDYSVVRLCGKIPFFVRYDPAVLDIPLLSQGTPLSLSLLVLVDPFSWSIQTVSRRRLIAASGMSQGLWWWRRKATGRDKGWGHSDTGRCWTKEMLLVWRDSSIKQRNETTEEKLDAIRSLKCRQLRAFPRRFEAYCIPRQLNAYICSWRRHDEWLCSVVHWQRSES